MKLLQLFKINQGHQITDEELYLTDGTIPVYTGKNEIKGYWNKSIIPKKELPCITYPTKANSGCVYVQKEIFDANNTGVLISLKEWKDKLDLEWFAHKLRHLFLKIQTSKGGVSYLNKEIVEDLEISIPDIAIQISERNILNNLLRKKDIIQKILDKINKTKESHIEIEYKSYQKKECPVDDLFEIIGGNSGLTEEYIYSNFESNLPKEYILITGSINCLENPIIIAKLPSSKNSDKMIKVLDGEGIQIIRKGKAGNINYLPHDKYTLNDDVYLLTLKKDSEWKLNLRWIYFTQKEVFKQFASSSDNGTWNKTGFVNHAKINIPKISEQNKIVLYFEKLAKYENRLININNKIKLLLEKDIE